MRKVYYEKENRLEIEDKKSDRRNYGTFDEKNNQKKSRKMVAPAAVKPFIPPSITQTLSHDLRQTFCSVNALLPFVPLGIGVFIGAMVGLPIGSAFNDKNEERWPSEGYHDYGFDGMFWGMGIGGALTLLIGFAVLYLQARNQSVARYTEEYKTDLCHREKFILWKNFPVDMQLEISLYLNLQELNKFIRIDKKTYQYWQPQISRKWLCQKHENKKLLLWDKIIFENFQKELLAKYLKASAGLRQLQQAPELFHIQPNLPAALVNTHQLILRPGKKISDFFRKPVQSPTLIQTCRTDLKNTFCSKWTPLAVFAAAAGGGFGAIAGGLIGTYSSSKNDDYIYGILVGGGFVLLLSFVMIYKMFRSDSVLTYRARFGEQMLADYQDGVLAIGRQPAADIISIDVPPNNGYIPLSP